MDDTGRYHLQPGTEERPLAREPSTKLELVPIEEDEDDDPTLVTTSALNRLDAAVDASAAVCEDIGRKSLELRRRMRRQRIDSGQKFVALISRPPPKPAVGG